MKFFLVLNIVCIYLCSVWGLASWVLIDFYFNSRIPPDCHHPERERHRCHFGSCPPCRQVCGMKYECGHSCPKTCHSAVLIDVNEGLKPSGPWEKVRNRYKCSAFSGNWMVLTSVTQLFHVYNCADNTTVWTESISMRRLSASSYCRLFRWAWVIRRPLLSCQRVSMRTNMST